MAEAASNASGPGAAAFRALNINVTDTAGNLRPLNLVLEEVAQRFEDTRDGTNKTAMAMQLFGKSGAELVPLLNSLSSLAEEAKVTGNIVSTEFAKKSEQFNDSMTRMEGAAGNLARAISGPLVGALGEWMERLNVVIGAQESLSLDLLSQDRARLAREYTQLTQAGLSAQSARAQYLIQQIDEVDAKIIAANQKLSAIRSASAQPGGGPKPEMVPVMSSGIGDMEAMQTALYMEELGKQLAALNQATSFRGAALTSWYTFETEADWANYLRKEEELNAWINKEYELLQVAYQNKLLSKEQMNTQMLQLDQAYADKKLKLEDDLSKKQTAGKQRFHSIDLGALQYMTGQMANMMQGSSKKQFEIGKKAAIANTLISTFQGAMDAFKALAGIPYVGPFMGAAAAAGVISMGMGNVSRIRSQQFGGGGSGGAVPTFSASPNTGLPDSAESSLVAPTLPQTAQASAQPRNVNITLVSESGQISAEWLRSSFIPALNEAVGDGVTLRVD